MAGYSAQYDVGAVPLIDTTLTTDRNSNGEYLQSRGGAVGSEIVFEGFRRHCLLCVALTLGYEGHQCRARTPVRGSQRVDDAIDGQF